MQIISVWLILKNRVPAPTMSQCNFCLRNDPSVDDICCNEGQQACGCCILGKNVNQGTICAGCQIPLRKKIFGLKAKIQLSLRNLQDKRGKNIGMGNKDQDQSDMHMMNMMNTQKKNQTFKNNQNQMNEDNYRNHNQGQYNMGQQYYPNLQMQPGVYPPYFYPPMNVPTMNPYMNGQMGSMSMPYQMSMMPPQYNNQNWSPHSGNANPNMNNLSQCMSPEQYQQYTQFRMIKNASKTIMPHHNSNHEGEKGQGKYWHGEHNDIVYNSRSQSKTTDMMEQSTVKSKFPRMARSNSASNLLQR